MNVNNKKIVIDSITRIQRHLRAEVEVDEDGDGVVKNAEIIRYLMAMALFIQNHVIDSNDKLQDKNYINV